MKKLKPVLLALLLAGGIHSTTHAQVVIGIGGGYGLPAAPRTVGYSQTIYSNSETDEVKNGSFGKGLHAGLFMMFMVSPKLGIELRYNYLSSATYSSRYEDNSVSGFSDTRDYDSKAKMMMICPGFRFCFGVGNNFRPYIRSGISLGIGAKMTETMHDVSSNPFTSSTTDRTQEYTGGISVGFASGLGVKYLASDHLGIFGEFAFNYQAWAPQKSAYTTYTVNGTDQLPSMQVYQKEFEYKDSYSHSSSPDPNQPTTYGKFYMPFSSWGVQVGVSYSFGNMNR